jgi:hypothetical protein
MDQVTNLAKDLSLNIKEHEPLPRQKYRNRFDFGKHLSDALVSIIMGHYAFEQVGEIGDDGNWHLTKLAPRPPETITEINIDAKGDLLGFKQLFSPQMIPVNRVTWYPYMMEGANWTGRSLLRACYRNWLRKDRLLRVDAQKQERNGIGIPIAEAPPGMSGGAMLRLDMLMRKMRAGDTSGGAVPNGTKVSLVGTTGTLPDTIASIRLDNEEMARSWLAMFMQLGQTQTGSRALGTEFIDFFADALDELANWICQIFTASVIENWWGWNVDEEADATPQLVYSRNPDSAFSGREFAMLLERGAIVMDDELENSIRERYGLPMRKPGLPQPVVPQPNLSEPWPPMSGEQTGGVTTPSPSNSPAGQGPMSDVPVYGARGSSERTVTGKSLSPVTLPNRPLRRELFAHELKAAVDWGSADANWKQQRDLLVSAVRKPQLQQMDELHDQLAEAGNSLAKIGEIQATPLLEDIIFTHMSTMATMGAHDAQQEASRQGITLQLPDLNQLSEDQRERAKVVDKFLADTLTNSAKSSAFVYAGGSLDGKTIADKVKEDLINLTTGYLQDQLGGALTSAMNDGRKATMAVAQARVQPQPVKSSKGKPIKAQAGEPAFTVYASELLDSETCDPCAAIDGTAYETIDDAEVDYPAGGYTDCDGWSRCRGTLIAVYGDEMPATQQEAEEAYQQVSEGKAVTYEEAASWSDVKDSDKLTAKETKQLQQALIDKFPSGGIGKQSGLVKIKGNFGELSTMDTSQMGDIGSALSEIETHMPEVIEGDVDTTRGALTEITFTSDPVLTGGFGPAAKMQKEILDGELQGAKAVTYKTGVNGHYGIMINDTIRAVEDMGLTDGPVQNSYDMMMHELGHQYANVHGFGADEILDEMYSQGMTFKDLAHISDYALTNPEEGFAEAFANTYGSNGSSWYAKDKFTGMMKEMSKYDSTGALLEEYAPAYKKGEEWVDVSQAAPLSPPPAVEEEMLYLSPDSVPLTKSEMEWQYGKDVADSAPKLIGPSGEPLSKEEAQEIYAPTEEDFISPYEEDEYEEEAGQTPTASDVELPTEDWQTQYDTKFEAQDYAMGHFNAAPDEVEKRAVTAYGGSSFTTINTALRDAKGGDFPATKIYAPGQAYGGTSYLSLKEVIPAIDNAIMESAADTDLTLFRGVKGRGVDALKDLQVGSVFSDYAYSSASLRLETAEEFGRTIVEIHVPKGFNSLSLDQTGTATSRESEVLLPRETQLRVLSINRDVGYYGGEDTVNHVVCEVVTNG